MIGAGFGNFLRAFPWTECRQIFGNPSVHSPHSSVGVSFDWEHLMSSAFVDAKTIVHEWLLYKRVFQTPEEIDFTDLKLTSTEHALKKLVFARSVLHQSNHYFEILAMAYLYFCGVYEEEREFMAVFCSLKYMKELARAKADENGQTEGKDTSDPENSSEDPLSVMIRFPDWPVFARWLRESVAEIEAVPRKVLASCAAHIKPQIAQLLQSHPFVQLPSPQGGTALSKSVEGTAATAGSAGSAVSAESGGRPTSFKNILALPNGAQQAPSQGWNQRAAFPHASAASHPAMQGHPAYPYPHTKERSTGPVAAEAEREWLQASQRRAEQSTLNNTEGTNSRKRAFDSYNSMHETGAPAFHRAPDGSLSAVQINSAALSMYGAGAADASGLGHPQPHQPMPLPYANSGMDSNGSAMESYGGTAGRIYPYTNGSPSAPTFSSYSAASQYASSLQQQQMSNQTQVVPQPVLTPAQSAAQQQQASAAMLAAYRQNPNAHSTVMRSVTRVGSNMNLSAPPALVGQNPSSGTTAGPSAGGAASAGFAGPSAAAPSAGGGAVGTGGSLMTFPATTGSAYYSYPDYPGASSGAAAGAGHGQQEYPMSAPTGPGLSGGPSGATGASSASGVSSAGVANGVSGGALPTPYPASYMMSYAPQPSAGLSMEGALAPGTVLGSGLNAVSAGAGAAMNASANLSPAGQMSLSVAPMNMSAASNYYSTVDPVSTASYGSGGVSSMALNGDGSGGYQQQQHQQLQHHGSLTVNRRQKKNRDKFKVTFMLPTAKAAELVKTYGIVLDTKPDNSKVAQQQRQASSGLHHLHLPGGQLSAHSQKDLVPYSVLVPLKGIDVLANGRYRVQLNTFMNGRKKFSRNSTDLYEALWIFEIALLISDTPILLSELQRIGNYNCLAPLGHLGFFCNPREYYLELGRHILLFYDTVDFFNEDLITLAIHNYDAMKPAVAIMPPGMLQLAASAGPVNTTHTNGTSGGPNGVPGGMTSATVGAHSNGGAQYNGGAAGAPAPGMNGYPGAVSASNQMHHSGTPGRMTAPAASADGAQSDSDGDEGDGSQRSHTQFLPHSRRPCSLTLTSRTEETVRLPWMAGYSSGLSLLEQQLSCLFCLRNLPLPALVPRISMLKEEKYTLQAHLMAAAANEVASNLISITPGTVLPGNYTTRAPTVVGGSVGGAQSVTSSATGKSTSTASSSGHGNGHGNGNGNGNANGARAPTSASARP